jgi:TonB family protein
MVSSNRAYERRTLRGAACCVAATFLVVSTRAAAGQEPLQVYKPGDGVTLPVVVRSVGPKYPSEAMRLRIQGAVHVACVVLANGVPDRVKVSRSLDPSLDESAVKAVEKWRFKPGTKDGKPVAVEISIVVAFALTPIKRKVFTPGRDVTTPVVRTRVEPVYPEEAMKVGVEGNVRLECVVEPDGTPSDIVVIRRLYPPLDEAAIQALKRWRFDPGRKKRQAVAVRIELEMRFSSGSAR